MQITLPDDRKLKERAAAAGCASLQEYLLQLVERFVQRQESADVRDQVSHDEWVKRFRELVPMAEPLNSDLDDSRESIYPVR